MDNYNQVLEAQAIQLNSAGLATERYQIYLESIEGKANTLTASMEALWQKTIDEDVIKLANFYILATSLEMPRFAESDKKELGL